MLYGECYILVNKDHFKMKAKSVEISGYQKELLISFELTQIFYHTRDDSKEVSYVFSNDMKICIYDTTFILGDEVIKPKLQAKEEAKAAYDEAVKSDHTAIFGTNLPHGMTVFKLGNLPPNTDCKVILKIAFLAHLTKPNTMFVKFPLDSYSPNRSRTSLKTNQFKLTLQGEKSKVKNITTNLKKSATYQNEECLLTIVNPENNKKKAIIIIIELNNDLESSSYGSKDCSAIIVSPNLPRKTTKNGEFIFIVDCSSSMRGESIEKARECLEIFVRSLPAESYFNVIRFGLTYEKLFPESEKYNDETAQKAIELAHNMEANIRGTNIYSPLKDALSTTPKSANLQRQFFVITDGKVRQPEKVINLVTKNNNKNRFFTIGIGRGCDSGLVEGIASHSGGKSNFVYDNISLSEKVILQLESSLSPSLKNIEVHIEGTENIEISPFPTPSINPKGASVIFVHSTDSKELNGDILVTGIYDNDTIDISINKEENNVENSTNNMVSLSDTILALFSYNLIHKLERKKKITEEEKLKIIELSIKSGVLCKNTAFIGISQSTQDCIYKPGLCSRPPPKSKKDNRDKRCIGSRHPPKSKKDNRDKQCIGSRHRPNNQGLRMVYDSPSSEQGWDFEFDSPSSKQNLIMIYDAPSSDQECDFEFDSPSSKQNLRMAFDEPSSEQECDFKFAPPRSCSRALPRSCSRAPPRSCSRAPPKIQFPDTFDYMVLARQQTAAGFWNDLKMVNQIGKTKIKTIIGIKKDDDDDENKIIATIVAVALLRKKANDKRNIWKMIEKKAIEWLEGQIRGIDYNIIISEIENQIDYNIKQ